ncbi:Phytocyanin domain containing protein [Parasponia andersonii]|uniref:Phytocyanin domain containing protein n=1 Tax=Parasponia andersonii TaxID=3476 RepID=A0A2P5B683_PARAD|nr:Phytocyanin domain containing protein [Parasponia andersonii]
MQFRILFALAALFGSFMIGSVRAMTHIVGGSHGWRVPDNKTYFDEWAKPRTFGVGDRLVFPSRPCGNNVIWVSKEDYETCTQNNVIQMYYEGPTILNLTQTGDYYFYNGVGKHCEAGQKLHINVGNKEGCSGNPHPFTLFDTKEGDTTTVATATAAPSKLPDAKSHSSAATIRNIGAVSATLLTFLLSLLI